MEGHSQAAAGSGCFQTASHSQVAEEFHTANQLRCAYALLSETGQDGTSWLV
jgi:hypothetical protein